MTDRQAEILLREALSLLTDPDTGIDLRDWIRAVRAYLAEK